MENEKPQDKLTSSDAMPGAKFQDPRPTDLQVFYELLPGVLSGFAGKSVDSRSTNASALSIVREMLGQCVAMGIMRMTVQCNDGSPLAILPNGGMMATGQPNINTGNGGGVVNQYPNQGNNGGVVNQYPNYGGGGQQYQPQGGGGARPGQTANIQPIAMFPNGTNPPQL